MPTFLTLPPEIRNAIYADVFVLPVNDPIPTVPSIESPLAIGLQLDPRQHPPQSSPTTTTASLSSSSESSSDSDSIRSPSHKAPRRDRPSHLRTLLTCRQIHREVHLLALSTTTFHLSSTSAHPHTTRKSQTCVKLSRSTVCLCLPLCGRPRALTASPGWL